MSQRQADNQGLRVNVLTMIVYPALLFCRLKIPCVFLLPDLQNDRAATVSGSALSATGNRLGRTPDPHRCNTDGLRPPTNRVAACTVQMGFAGGWRGSWRPESPWLGVSARLTS
ncbi:hypothetical protein JDR89_23885 [Escherichia coli]|uniref:hypothetical protein n=7 Tax=Enterobacterales TaxID=91347 RepID=UPI001482313C|nr:hypothetical protein [Escherichia coli]EED1410430.1 hypothetical protein [Escherichia coli]EER8556554.1 hypothetical protein [Escherichia coli]ELL6086367.1 hypothetical protein [Escherichia coli]ELN7907116.1 hypothetical protein [Escherichia coli]EMC8786095.1 hypothetical protein [Escherichia coli]